MSRLVIVRSPIQICHHVMFHVGVTTYETALLTSV